MYHIDFAFFWTLKDALQWKHYVLLGIEKHFVMLILFETILRTSHTMLKRTNLHSHTHMCLLF